MNDSVTERADAVDLKRTRRRAGGDRRVSGVNIDRLPPNAPECEQGALGCQLETPAECIPEAIAIMGDTFKDVYYDLRHQTIQESICELYKKQIGIDLITVQQHLKERNLLEQVGGIAYLSKLQEMVFSSTSNLPIYLQKLKEKHTLRKLISVCSGTIGRIYDNEGDFEELLDEVEKDIHKATDQGGQNKQKGIKELVNETLIEIESIVNRKGEISGISTGFADLDKMTNGLHGGEMIIVAARPSMGKSSISMNIAEHVALELGLPVGVFSLEMSASSLTMRMVCSLARVNLRSMQQGWLNDSDYPKIMSASSRLAAAPLHIDDESGLSIMQLRARARRMVQQHGIKLFVIDYLQLLNSNTQRAKENRQQEVADISSGVKAMSKELNVPVIVLSQLNREMEKDKNRKPRLSDLRESGAVEQDADLVGLLYKPKTGEDDDEIPEESDGVLVNLLIAKQRNGPTGEVNLTFLKPYTRFESAARITEKDLPMRSTSSDP